jgi:hypothetical protein
MRIPSTGNIIAKKTSLAFFNRRRAGRWRIRWSDITEIAMWKVDCVVIDMLCLGFRIEGSTSYYCCDEHADGWQELQPHLLRRYNFKIEDWWNIIVLPPLEEKFAVVWKR